MAVSDFIAPRTQDFKVACVYGSLWSLLLVGAYRANSALTDMSLFSIHVFIYFLFWLIISWCVRVVVTLRSGGQLTAGGSTAAQFTFSTYLTVLMLAFWLFRKQLDLSWLLSLTLLIPLVVAGAIPIRKPIFQRLIALPAFKSNRLVSSAAFLTFSILLLYSVSFQLSLPGTGRSTADTIKRGDSENSGFRVKLLAIDGVDWNVLRELMGEGRLPHFRKLIDRGAVGNLDTISAHSPVVWTSIATGVPPRKHGVQSYITPYLLNSSVVLPPPIGFDVLGEATQVAFGYREIRSVSSNTRRAKALWEVLSVFGRKSLWVNWWASYPAEDIRGVLVSNFAVPWNGFSEDAVARLAERGRLVSPAGRQDDVLNLVREVAWESGNYEPGKENDEEYYRLRDEAVLRIHAHLQDGSFSLSSVYLQSIDTSSHAYTDIAFGENVDEIRPLRIPAREADLLWQRLVREAYERMDRTLGIVLNELSETECLVVVSDHGWRYDGTSHWRLPPGVFLLHGKPFEEGVVIPNAHVYDIFPTLAYLLDVPVSRELRGRVLLEAFDEEFKTRHKVQHIETYGLRRQNVPAERLEEDEDLLDRLRSLGYIR